MSEIPEWLNKFSYPELQAMILSRDHKTSQLQATIVEKDKEIERLNKPLCNVCAGDPDFHTKCICGGVGTVWAECEGLRHECISLQDKLDAVREYCHNHFDNKETWSDDILKIINKEQEDRE